MKREPDVVCPPRWCPLGPLPLACRLCALGAPRQNWAQAPFPRLGVRRPGLPVPAARRGPRLRPAEQLRPVMAAALAHLEPAAATAGFHLSHEAAAEHRAPWSHMPFVFSARSVFLAPASPVIDGPPC